MALNTDWKEFLKLLESNGVDFLVVGAWARAFYGEPRMTGDIDFWVLPTPVNASKLIKAINDYGFSSLGLRDEDFLAIDQVQLGFPPRRIDLLTGLTGLDFECAWPNRTLGELDGITVSYISKEDFIKNKLATGRAKDLADIEAIAGD